MAGLYLHIPFCKQACYYCDFHFSTNLDKQAEMVNAISKELELQKDYLQGEVVQTVYFGGGTPSLLTAHELSVLLESIKLNYQLSPSPEITLEANPDDLTSEKLLALKQVGVNRLSIGIQSFDDIVLRYLNRSHTLQSSYECFQNARSAGFENISVDIIYAIPGVTIAQWEQLILAAVQLRPEHISAYTLTIEPQTVFGNWQAKNKIKEVSDDNAAIQMELLVSMLEQEGYEQYEVSNFCKPGYYSKHNSSYWLQKKYLGIGPSAHSFNGTSRQYNISSNHHYLRAISRGEIPCEKEVLTEKNKINEYLLTSLRTMEGCDTELLRAVHGVDLLAIHKTYVQELLRKELATLADGQLRLTKSGKLLADKIASDFFQD